MERVTFIVTDTNARISCLLNPEHLVQRRTAGLRRPYAGAGYLTATAASDDVLLHTGGGRTEIDLDLLFDVELAPPRSTAEAPRNPDVRELTRPLWELAENTGTPDDPRRTSSVRMFWGDHWNVLCTVVAVAERLERFDASGSPSRSWLRLRLVRIPDPTPPPLESPTDGPTPEQLSAAAASAEVAAVHVALDHGRDAEGEQAGGERLDELAARYYGQPWLWRLIAVANGLYDSVFAPPGAALVIPEAPAEATR